MAAQPLSGRRHGDLAPRPIDPSQADSGPTTDAVLASSGRTAWRWGRLETAIDEPDSERAALMHDLLTVLLPLAACVTLSGLLLGLALRWAP